MIGGVTTIVVELIQCKYSRKYRPWQDLWNTLDWVRIILTFVSAFLLINESSRTKCACDSPYVEEGEGDDDCDDEENQAEHHQLQHPPFSEDEMINFLQLFSLVKPGIGLRHVLHLAAKILSSVCSATIETEKLRMPGPQTMRRAQCVLRKVCLGCLWSPFF